MSRSSFTLIELLVVIAILAVLAVAVVFVINPLDLMKQTRDTSRLSDLNNLNKALSVFDVTNPDDFTGTSTNIYTSLPASSAGPCPGMTAPAGYTYQCVTSSTLTKVDGTGWIPVNFNAVTYGSCLSKLPIDPVNSSTTGQYYTYVMGGSWELNAILESQKYRADSDIAKSNLPGVLSIGSNKTLSPVYTTAGLIAYYPFTEQTGTTLNDPVGGHTGTITPGTGRWTTDNLGNPRAYDFDGTHSKVDTGSDWIGAERNYLTISIWIFLDGSTGVKSVVGNNTTTTNAGVGIWTNKNAYSTTNNIVSVVNNGVPTKSANESILTGQWYHVVFTYDVIANQSKFYINGVQSGSTGTASSPNAGNNVFIGGKMTSLNFDGRITDLRVYDRILSTTEIMAIYNATK